MREERVRKKEDEYKEAMKRKIERREKESE